MPFDNPDKMDYPPMRRGTVAFSFQTALQKTKVPSDQWHPTGRNARERYLRRNYGIGLDHHDALFVAQGGSCAICKQVQVAPKILHVDHCHASGRVRGLLCEHCNRGVGGFKDNPEWCLSAAKYLLGDIPLETREIF